MSVDNKLNNGKNAEAEIPHNIKAVVGLGNPGKAYQHQRHNIGFKIVDALAERYGGRWREREYMQITEIQLGGRTVLLVKPQTFMNNSGKVVPYLVKQGIAADNILVVHDELELPFGQIKMRKGGSHRGHNGLKSIIAGCGHDFWRLRFGIGRPEDKARVAEYVLHQFDESLVLIEELAEKAASMLELLS